MEIYSHGFDIRRLISSTNAVEAIDATFTNVRLLHRYSRRVPRAAFAHPASRARARERTAATRCRHSATIFESEPPSLMTAIAAEFAAMGYVGTNRD
jgi:hypothetical protein